MRRSRTVKICLNRNDKLANGYLTMYTVQHRSDDYSRFGSLDNCSAFPFENHMKVLKKYVRKINQPLQ
ncbi:Uncharacterized protein FWK35_00029288 [Aphis craccivora]|uniref:Uncharacterized protein n=1 Tax=Aphis craccivora TaxID=307492 RepID=A0A6G0VNZ6_APHCR|nr:Uncharacterized protein FWK35_00029288 [Aphis craccivora]